MLIGVLNARAMATPEIAVRTRSGQTYAGNADTKITRAANAITKRNASCARMKHPTTTFWGATSAMPSDVPWRPQKPTYDALLPD